MCRRAVKQKSNQTKSVIKDQNTWTQKQAFLFQPADIETNNINYVQSEDLGQPGCLPSPIRVVTAVRFMGSYGLTHLHVDSEDWSDWMDAQADLSLCWAHRTFCWFCHVLAHFTNQSSSQSFKALLSWCIGEWYKFYLKGTYKFL